MCLSLLQSHILQPARLLCPWDFPGKNTGKGWHFPLQGRETRHRTQIFYIAGVLFTAETLGKPIYFPRWNLIFKSEFYFKWDYTISFLELLAWIWILRVCLQVVNSFFCFTFLKILSRRDIFCYCLPLSGWVPLGYDPSRSIPVATSDIISLLQFWFLWLISRSYIRSTYCLSLICR